MWMWLLIKISIYHTFIQSLLKKINFWNEKFQISPNMVHIMWNDMVQYTFNFNKLKKSFNFFWDYICVFEYTSALHLFSKIYSNLPLYKMKRNNFEKNILLILYFNIICKTIVKFFQKFEVGHNQTCTSLVKWYNMTSQKGSLYCVFTPHIVKTLHVFVEF